MKKQPFLDKELFSHSLSYGGILRNKRKGRSARPLSPKNPIHLVLKGTLAKKEWSFRIPKNHRIVSVLLEQLSKAYGIRIDQKAIQGDHIHLLLRVRNRSLYKRFIRSLSGQIAMFVTDARNSAKSLKKEGIRFFKYRPFTRVVKGWKPYQTAKAYVILNADFYPQVSRSKSGRHDEIKWSHFFECLPASP
ncbi:MAG: transposase [Pseudobdellovibrionaceae bacterium]